MLIFIFLYFFMVFANACVEHQTCRACIRSSEPCVWCASETINGPRCISENSIPQNWCLNEIQNPSSTKTVIHHQLNSASDSNEIIQIKPKSIDMNLRPGQTLDFTFSYTAAEHYPVDIYYLFDASMDLESWNDHQQQTITVIRWLQTMTNNVSIGFGTFTNKNVLPFTSIKNEILSYSFRHHFTLSRDIEGFVETMKNVNLVDSAVIDNANGGFDALAQAIVCRQIGWRSVSRRIVIFISNTAYLAAGDASAAGIFNPYDGKCHTQNGLYTKELDMDYPSTYMINKLASEQKVTTIFVSKTMKAVYDQLKRVINGVHVIYPEVTKTHKESVVTQLKQTYENITRIVKFHVNIDPDYADKIIVNIYPDCNKQECLVEQTKERQFSGEITVLEYFEAEEIKVTISIAGIKETLALDIRLVTECNCAPGNDGICNGGGLRQCGICECFQNRSGINCECPSMNASGTDTDNKNISTYNKSSCIKPNSTIECSGRGSCFCGICKCGEKRYQGRFCECDNEICPKDKSGRLCGHGQCRCGECNCEPGWTKTSQRICSCESSKDRCQTGEHECSNYGHCECNKCKCPETICDWDARSSLGKHCNPLSCDDCHGRQCRLLEPYALRLSDGSTPCGRRVNVTSVQKLGNETSWMLCSKVRSNVGCYTNFLYQYDGGKYGVHLIVQSEHDCAESAYIYGGSCLGGLLLIGILTLLCWKVLSTYRDRKEYVRFRTKQQESVKRSARQENPLFQSPVTTFTNPKHDTS